MSETELNQFYFQSVGLVEGRYQPSDQLERGLLITEEGTFTAMVASGFSGWLKKQENVDFSKFKVFVAWLRTPKPERNAEPIIKFLLVGGETEEAAQKRSPEDLNRFRVSGIITKAEEGRISVEVRRNESPPPGKKKLPSFQPFKVRIQGFLPNVQVGEFWNLELVLEDSQLVIEDGVKMADAPKEQKQQGKKKKKKKGRPSGKTIDLSRMNS